MTYDPDHVGCCIEPEWVEQQDGWYTERIRIISPFVAGRVDDEHTFTPSTLSFVTEPLEEPIPRYKRVLVWREVR